MSGTAIAPLQGTLMTPELLRTLLPRSLHHNASQEFADKVNQVVSDPEAAELIRENFVTYAGVLKDGKYKTEDYLNAVAYVTQKLMGATNTDAYKRAFPQRYTNLVAAGRTDKEISSYVAAYAKNKLVNVLVEQTAIPSHLLFQDVMFEAIKTQRDLMLDVNVSPKVRSDAANSLLTHLKAPEVKKVELAVDVKSDGLADLRSSLSALAQGQLAQIEAGVVTPGAAAAARLIRPEVELIDAEFSEVAQSTGEVEPQENTAAPPAQEAELDEAPTQLTRAKRKSIFDIDPSNPGAD